MPPCVQHPHRLEGNGTVASTGADMTHMSLSSLSSPSLSSSSLNVVVAEKKRKDGNDEGNDGDGGNIHDHVNDDDHVRVDDDVVVVVGEEVVLICLTAYQDLRRGT